MNRRYFSLVLAMLLGVALVLAPLTSFASSSEDEQTQIMRTPPCPGHEYIVYETGSIRYHWKSNTAHTKDKEFIQICKNCGSQGGYAYVTIGTYAHELEARTSYHPTGTTKHYFYNTCRKCPGRINEVVKDCPGGEYGHVVEVP